MKTVNVTRRLPASRRWGALKGLSDVHWDVTLHALQGMRTLEAAVVFGDGAGYRSNDTNSIDAVRIRWPKYADRLSFLPSRLKTVAESFDYYWLPLTRHLFKEISQSCVGLNTHTEMSPVSTQRWIRAQLINAMVEPVSLDALMRDPGNLMKFAVRQLCHVNGDSQSSLIPAVPWLAVLHIAALHFGYDRCGFCFRWAQSGQRYCPEHSQSEAYPGSKATKARNYRVGYDTALLLGWTRHAPRLKVQCDRDFASKAISYHLWGARPSSENRLFVRIRAEIAKAPRVHERIGSVLPKGNAPLHALLRERLDPLELWPMAWPEKIRLAEKWFAAEAKVTPCRRGPSAKTTSDITRAEGLARKGWSITAIAHELGCSRTTITKWCVRGRAPRLKELLEQRPRAPRRIG